MSEAKRIEGGYGDEITVRSNRTHVLVAIHEAHYDITATIWLTAEEADELVVQIAKARVELSKARPTS